MSSSHEKPELPSDAQYADAVHDEMQIESLLQSGYAAPGPSSEFQEALQRELSQTYVMFYPADVVAAAGQEVPAAVPSRRQVGQRRVGLRLAMTLATAASLLLAVSIWNNQSAYGWANMLRALEDCVWVQATSESSGQAGWASSEHGILAIHKGRDVAFSNQNEQTSLQYVSSQRVVLQQAMPAQQVSVGPGQLIYQLLCADNDGAPDRLPDSLSEFEVLSESWRRVPADKSDKSASPAVDLTVMLCKPSQPSKVSVVVTRLDAETHLPMSSRLLTANGRKTTKQAAIGKGEAIVRFSYPQEGPSTIYALGVPRDAQIVASLAGFAPGAVGETETKLLASNANQVAASSRTLEVEEFVSEPAVAEPVMDNTDKRGDDSSPVALLASAQPAQESTLNTVFDLSAGPVTQARLIEQVNTQMAANWHAQGITPSELAGDTEFLRRVYLDLTGRVPMVSEVYEFLEDGREDRREQLVDDLLASRDHATHMATVWRKLLLPVGEDTRDFGGTVKFDTWLADRFEKNIPYDQVVRQLLLAEGRVSDSGPILFYAALKLNPEELAGKTARTFLGMRMECAQCHDHPFDEAISQEDFWGFAAHFAQISRPIGKMEAASSVLRVRDNRRGDVMLPESEEIVPPSLPYDVASAGVTKRAAGTEVETVESLSRRELLADWITSKQNGRFSRATVNRVWQHLFGRGLVEPVDDMRVDNPATCPEVLDTLSLDFTVSNYDLRRLLRTLVLSDAYQLSSRAATDDPSQGLVFARMNIKSFSADQLYDCINVATQLKSPGRASNRAGAIARFGNTSREAFIEKFRAPPGQRTDYHAGIPQALTLMHGYLVHGATDLTRSGLLKSLGAPFFTDEQRIETLFLSTLSRRPESTELETMVTYLQEAKGDAARTQALGDILWALLNSAEFTFIH